MYRTIVARLPNYALQRRAIPHIGASMTARPKPTQPPAALGPASPHRNRPAPSRHSRFTPHVGATAAGPPRTPHRAHLAYGTALKLSLGPRNKKSAQTATFFAISNCSKLSNRESRHKNAGNWPCCGLLPPSGDEKRAPNRKKVAKMPRFLFLRRAKPPQRAELP